jgi:hypothetical protein
MPDSSTPQDRTAFRSALRKAAYDLPSPPAAAKTPGQVACEEWTRFHGSPYGFKPWNELPERVQAAWDAVARAVLSAGRMDG